MLVLPLQLAMHALIIHDVNQNSHNLYSQQFAIDHEYNITIWQSFWKDTSYIVI